VAGARAPRRGARGAAARAAGRRAAAAGAPAGVGRHARAILLARQQEYNDIYVCDNISNNVGSNVQSAKAGEEHSRRASNFKD